ncbi:uncharacterized protein LOC143306631 [Osmia lignaria lignaria]|uniref:uncharacterized protein LOC143306631 n=1 Tax=Osmia lignaria lignaria TaxID=1437193 RepID=UPI00402BD5C5
MGPWYLLLSIASIQFATANHMEGDYSVTRLRSNPGLYAEKLAPIRTFRTTWRLVTALDVTEILTSRPDTIFAVNRMKTMCKSQNITSCPMDTLKEELDRKLAEAVRYENLLAHALGKNAVRVRRASLGFIGSISKILFGTLDETDAEYYNREIDKIYNDQKQITSLIHNQTHVIKSEFRKAYDTLNILSKLATTMNTRIEHVLSKTSEISKREDQLELELAMSSWGTRLIRQTDEYVLMLSTLTDAVMFAKLGILHPMILSPDQLITACQTIQTSTNLEFPLSMEELKSEQLQGTTTMSAVYAKGRVIITIDFPLLEPNSYELYHLYPCSSFQQLNANTSTTLMIQPQTDFLAIDQATTIFFSPDKSYLKTCKNPNGRLLCEITLPLQNYEQSHIYEIDLILRPEHLQWKQCNVKAAPANNIQITKLEAPNTWLFSMQHKEAVQIKCNKRSAGYEQIQGAGIIQLQSHCKATIDHTRIMASGIKTQKYNYTFKSSFGLNIPNLIPDLTPHHIQILTKLQENQPKFTPINIDPDNLLTLQEIDNQAQDIAQHHRALAHTAYITYGSLSAVSVVITIIIAAIGYRYYRKRAKNANQPRRRQFTTEDIKMQNRPTVTPTTWPSDLQIAESPETQQQDGTTNPAFKTKTILYY